MTCFDIELAHQKNSNHVLTRIMLSTLLLLHCWRLCYSIMSHTTLILYYHASTLTLQTSIISCALWLPYMHDIGRVRVHLLCDLGKRSSGVRKWCVVILVLVWHVLLPPSFLFIREDELGPWVVGRYSNKSTNQPLGLQVPLSSKFHPLSPPLSLACHRKCGLRLPRYLLPSLHTSPVALPTKLLLLLLFWWGSKGFQSGNDVE